MHRLPALLATLAFVATPLAHAADAAPARHCAIVAAEYETEGTISNELMADLRVNARVLQGRLLQRLQADKLVANGVYIDVDDRPLTTERVDKIRATTGCDTVVDVRSVLWMSTIGSAFGADVVVRRNTGGAMSTVYSRQYRYGIDTATLAAFSYDAFTDAAWADLRGSAVLDIDREARPVDPAAVRADYDRAAAAWPKDMPEYHLRHILRESELLCIAMLARLHADPPTDFATLAAASSDDKSSSDKGGDIGWTPAFSLPNAFSAAIRAQGGKPGLVDHPVHAEDGWHVLEVLDSRPSHAPPFADVSERFALRQRWTAVVPQATWDAALKQQ